MSILSKLRGEKQRLESPELLAKISAVLDEHADPETRVMVLVMDFEGKLHELSNVASHSRDGFLRTFRKGKR